MASQAADSVRRLIRLIKYNLEKCEADVDSQALDSLISYLDLLIINMNQMRLSEDIIVAVSNCHALITRFRDTMDCLETGVHLDLESPTKPGRPRYTILQEQLEALLYLNMDCPTIASTLGISLRTLRRRMTDFNLSVKDTYSVISDIDLEQAVKSIKELFPNAGYRMMDALLRDKGIKITQSQLREAMHNTDPNGLVVRMSECIQRRKYHVPGPQSLWHIDGNCKLVR